MKNEKNLYVQVKVQAPPEYLEALSAYLFALNAEGIQEEENGFVVFFRKDIWSPEKHQLLLKELQAIIPDFDQSRLQIETQEEEDWLHNWKENFKPFHLTPRVVVQPDWENYQPDRDELVITIAPKMAFGTGHHESTQLALMLMEEFLKPGMRVLDVGTGSGILTIYAAQKGASFILGIDNDAVSIENAMENAALNGVAEKIIFRIRDAREFYHPDFDLVVANINRNVLLEIVSGLQKALKPSGILILSGILKQDRPVMLEALKAFPLEQVAEKTKNEWLGLAFKKKAVH